MQPILANGCARAATAAEAAFRIDRPIGGRTARVVALDDRAAETIRRVAQRPWTGATFYVAQPGGAAAAAGGDGTGDDVALRAVDGPGTRLSTELEDADVAIVVATTDDGAAAASAIAEACERRGIMTAGLILGGPEARAAVNALRPHAPVLLVTDDEEDVSEVLTALRA